MSDSSDGSSSMSRKRRAAVLDHDEGDGRHASERKRMRDDGLRLRVSQAAGVMRDMADDLRDGGGDDTLYIIGSDLLDDTVIQDKVAITGVHVWDAADTSAADAMAHMEKLIRETGTTLVARKKELAASIAAIKTALASLKEARDELDTK